MLFILISGKYAIYHKWLLENGPYVTISLSSITIEYLSFQMFLVAYLMLYISLFSNPLLNNCLVEKQEQKGKVYDFAINIKNMHLIFYKNL